VGSLPSSSIVSPQRPPSGASVSSLNGRVQMLLRLCSSTICSQIDRMSMYRKTYIMHAILFCSEASDCNKDEMPCGNVRTTAVGMSPTLSLCCAAVSASLEDFRRSAQRSQELQNLTIVSVKSHSILRMLLQSLTGLCLAPGGSESI